LTFFSFVFSSILSHLIFQQNLAKVQYHTSYFNYANYNCMRFDKRPQFYKRKFPAEQCVLFFRSKHILIKFSFFFLIAPLISLRLSQVRHWSHGFFSFMVFVFCKSDKSACFHSAKTKRLPLWLNVVLPTTCATAWNRSAVDRITLILLIIENVLLLYTT
jgi:hypothetical protein